MEYIIVGTAGHVDHGKTALITALTGFEGDSLEEEKRRGITINLSFSSMQNESKTLLIGTFLVMKTFKKHDSQERLALMHVWWWLMLMRALCLRPKST